MLLRALPQILASIVALVAFAAASPSAQPPARHRPADRLSGDQSGRHGQRRHHRGGVASVDLSFVMALQSARFLVVLLIGPWLARLVARRLAE